jgi:hypothetical protein
VGLVRSGLGLTLTLTPCPTPNQVFRGFIEWGDKDLYEYDLNCKSIAANLASVRTRTRPRPRPRLRAVHVLEAATPRAGGFV